MVQEETVEEHVDEQRGVAPGSYLTSTARLCSPRDQAVPLCEPVRLIKQKGTFRSLSEIDFVERRINHLQMMACP
jgi:hypothetical protein